MYIQILLFYNICSLTHFHIKKYLRVNNVRKYQKLFSYEHSVSLGQPQYTYGFSNLSLTLSLQYARNSGIYKSWYIIICLMSQHFIYFHFEIFVKNT